MSRYWKPSRNGKEDFEDIYYQYKNNEISITEAAYHCGISVMGFWKRCKYYEENGTSKYEKTSKIVKKQAMKLMQKHLYKIKKYKIEYQDALTDVLYRTCIYIYRNKNNIINEENLIIFSLNRKVRDLKYEKHRKKEQSIYNSNDVWKNDYGDSYTKKIKESE